MIVLESLKAMAALNLDMIGLPGARLGGGIDLSGAGLRKAVRWEGGSSYASVATAWKTRLQASELEGFGSHRRIWLRVQLAENHHFFLCVLHFPPQAWKSGDARWLAELAGLETDIDRLQQMFGEEAIASTVLAGDINFQPPEKVQTNTNAFSRNEHI